MPARQQDGRCRAAAHNQGSDSRDGGQATPATRRSRARGAPRPLAPGRRADWRDISWLLLRRQPWRSVVRRRCYGRMVVRSGGVAGGRHLRGGVPARGHIHGGVFGYPSGLGYRDIVPRGGAYLVTAASAEPGALS